MQELLTILDYARWAMSQFRAAKLHYGHGTDNAWDEAVALIMPALHLEPSSDPRILNARLTQSECQLLTHLIKRRVEEQVPTPYLTHTAWFAGEEYFVDERVLIPRSPMAELILQHFEPWVEPVQVHRILDICTGSGCIAIACALAFPDAQVDAVDISEPALEVAKINVQKHQVEERVHLLQSDLCAAVQGKQYDVIISNPPYVGLKEWQALPKEYEHEPKLALVAEDDGLALVFKILKQAASLLSPQGVLIVEVGNSADLLQEKLPRVPFMWLEFEQGEGEVFLLTAQQLQDFFR